MSFFLAAVGTFFMDNILALIIRYLPFRNKKVWTIAVISVANLFEIGIYLYNFIAIALAGIASEFVVDYVLSSLFEILGIAVGYIAAMGMILDGGRIFKSRRQKNFEKALNGKENGFLGKCIPYVLLVIGLALSGYAVYLFVADQSSKMWIKIGTLLGAVLCIGLFVYLILGNGRKPVREKLLYFLATTNETYCFSCTGKENVRELLGSVYEDYFFDDYGYLIFKTEKYHCFGMKVDELSGTSLESIKMRQEDFTRFQDFVGDFAKFQRKKIYIDEENRISKIVTIK